MRRIAIALFTCIMILLSTAMVASPQSIAYGHTWGGKEYDFESAIAVDSVGNVYIAGYSVAAGTWITSGFLAKFDPNGNLQWSKEISSQFSDSCIVTQLAVAESGDVYVTGQTSQSGSTAFVAKFTSDGTLLYSRGLSNLSYPESLAVDPTTGGFVIAATSTSNWMGVVAAFNADGSWKWMRYEPTYQAYPYGVAVNADGNTYAFCDISTYGTVVGLTKFDATGNVLAQKRLNTAAVGQAAWDVRFAPDGNLVALGTR